MMSVMDNLHEKAKALHKTIVLPEGNEIRTLKAAVQALNEGLITPILIGKEDEIKALAAANDLDVSQIKIVDNALGATDKYAAELFELRKKKGMSMEEARELAQNPLYFGALMLRLGEADGMVAGAENATSNVLRAAIQVVKTKPGMKNVSGCFLIDLPDKNYGDDGAFIFGDCAVIPAPDSEQLADIAVSCAESKRLLIGGEPKVAMMSFSTKGSAKHESIDKMNAALALAKEKAPDLLIDGEMQLDAAVVPAVSAKKCPDSPLVGKANVLIFPDLNSGNLCYKMAQRFGHATAIGPILQGLTKPVNDLSRGCSVQDIVDIFAVTALQGE